MINDLILGLILLVVLFFVVRYLSRYFDWIVFLDKIPKEKIIEEIKKREDEALDESRQKYSVGKDEDITKERIDIILNYRNELMKQYLKEIAKKYNLSEQDILAIKNKTK